MSETETLKTKKEGRMRRMLKTVLLGTVVGSIGIWGTALAGEEACFIIKKGAPSTVTAANLLNVNWSNCDSADTPEPVSVAYELTGNLLLDLSNVAGNETSIVYVPTTDIPPGTLIKFKLTGAKWNEGGTLYLLKAENTADNDGAVTDADLVSIASTDGPTSGTDTITFITKAGVTIGAGTKLVISSTEDITDNNDPGYTPPKILIQNSGCPTDAKVTISVPEATTDGGTGYTIQGAEAKDTTLVEEKVQYEVFVAPAAATYAEVDVESNRLNFVPEIVNGDVDKAQLDKVIYPVTVKNYGPSLDLAITETDADYLELKFIKDDGVDLPSDMDIKLYDSVTDGSPDVFGDLLSDVAGSSTFRANGTSYDFGLTAIMTDDDTDSNATVDTNKFYIVVTNGTDIMPYNYKITTSAIIDFVNSDYIDHCEIKQDTHEIGINGAVIKVPYFSVSDTWPQYIKIVNEDVADAEVYVDLMANGTLKQSIHVGKAPKKGELWVWGSELKSLADENGISPDANNSFEAVFTVTAPKNKVHATSIQKTPSGQRVVPVLDQNDWSQ